MKLQFGLLPVRQALQSEQHHCLFCHMLIYLSLAVQTLMSAESQVCAVTGVSAGIWTAVLNAAASWDTESTTGQSPSIPKETKLPAKVKRH